MHAEICIIGSGLSAMAAAAALAARGCRPLILDTGLEPDPEARSLRGRLATAEPEDWRAEDLARLRRTGPPAANGIPRKLWFGSDFAFREMGPAVKMDLRNASVHRSFAAGGFSNVWGGAIQPLGDAGFDGWPLSARDLAPHYAAIDELIHGGIGSSATQDNGPASESGPGLRPSRQAAEFLADLEANRDRLAGDGIGFSPSRLAARDGDGPDGCRYCGLCLYGCPYGRLYSARDTLDRLRTDGAVEYIPGMVVDRIRSTGDGLEVEARSCADGGRQIVSARRVFLGAGLLSTARIVLHSLEAFDTPVRIRHSDIFTLPVLRHHAAEGIFNERLHTLCQLFMEIEDRAAGIPPVHLQWYGYNDLYPRILRERAGRAGTFVLPAFRPVHARLFTVFGYLPSGHSSEIELRLTGGAEPRLELTGHPNPEAIRISRGVARKLFRLRRVLRAVPLTPLLRLDLPGGGYHSGGTFSMRRTPGRLETDRRGGLAALPGLHLIDASVLPEVPAAPLAFTVMANAHRIAAEVPLSHGH